jgi:hypothetical protein
MNRYVVLSAVLVMATVLLAACGGGGKGGEVSATANPADFQATVDNRLYPLPASSQQVYEGEEPDPDTGNTIKTRVESRVLPKTDRVAGVEVTVVEDKEFKDGELVESTLDYFAQHRDGSVYYFGERVDEYEEGKVVSHEGQWLAGQGKNREGVFMPAQPTLGQVFEQEKAPGVAEDTSTIVDVDQSVTTPAGSFKGCVKTEDFNPLDKATEFKYFCPGVGLVREEFPDGHLDLISYE